MNNSTVPTIQGIHHSAFLCRDAQETRDFYEGVLGLRTRCALKITTRPGTDLELRYMHIFFEMADGNYIAFFDLPDSVKEEYFRNKDSMQEYHFAMEVADEDALQAFRQKLEASGVAIRGPIDHRFVKSIYFHDPNGLQLEFTVRAEDHDEFLDAEQAQVDEILSAWSRETATVKAERLSRASAA
ncbi:MAG: VOC family protein [Chromatiales bacterium]|jgi:catechol 2,3-dioxygenase-like lactoylglutathione lyase family enzyme|nr:VOC family protein [Chromatiales bacterium]